MNNHMRECLDCAQQLEEANRVINSGRGTQVFSVAISYLNRFDLESAKQVVETDFDKLYQYPEAYPVLLKIGFVPDYRIDP